MQFVAMTDAEFERYIADAATRYAADIARATTWSAEEALAKARAQLDGLLSAGRHTPGHRFLHVLGDAATRSGALWIASIPAQEPPRLFLYDIHLVPAARGQGLGTRVMAWLESEARAQGLPAIGLSVFRHNAGAVRLYERLGYEVEAADSAGMALLRPVSRGCPACRSACRSPP